MAPRSPRERGVLFQPDMVRAVMRPVDPKRITRRLHKLGDVGDVLWGREAYRLLALHDAKPPRDVPPGSFVHWEADVPSGVDLLFQGSEPLGKLRPSMFMCRWMSRIELLLVDVREERLQSITEADAKAEGADELVTVNMTDRDRELFPLPLFSAFPYRNGFALLWESIQGEGSWTENPMVFRHVFERVK